MNQKKFLITLGALLLIILLFTGYVAVGAEYGTKNDPVVTLSYLTNVYSKTSQSQIDSAVSSQSTVYSSSIDSKISTLQTEVNSKLSTLNSKITGLLNNSNFAQEVAEKVEADGSSQSAKWEAVQVASGKTLKTKVGTQVVLRIGSATCSSSGSVGFVNLTGGGNATVGGSLVKNNLYMATVEGLGVKVSSAATVLVAGDYTIE